ncbi:hypothetical protein [Sphingomonas sp. SRS2]|uniref:hypothetical protein n=1 Tax=Sphingomonas sp. SRS2 TaxID=133190 RepID=UPI000A520D1F|nr:hypothetical protein [Sphingomonas sp. SRS2]
MKKRRSMLALATGFLAITASQAIGAPPVLTPGMAVSDPAGGAVGTIESVTAEAAIVATGTHKVALPLTSFAKNDKGAVIGLTRTELDAAAAKAAENAAAVLRAQIIPGVMISGSQGNALGTVKAIEGDLVVVASDHGDARLPIAAIGNGPKGLMVGMTAAEFEAAVKGPQ